MMSVYDPACLSASLNSAEKTCRFHVWAPLKDKMTLRLLNPERNIDMIRDAHGYFSVTLGNVEPDCQYFFVPEGDSKFPDPASNFQPLGVHGCSQVVDHFSFEWTDQSWKGLPFRDLIIYELHVGTFTPEGTFEAIIPRLKALRDCGINAIELMPVNQFPGNRNWGYDSVFPYAVQNSYGGPQGLKKLVNACHEQGVAIILDIVYNHLGPEGNYLQEYGPYFSKRYQTPWGESINFDGEWSDGVRDYFVNSALYWFYHFRIDGLRLDAIHMIFDQGAVHFWQYLNEKIQRLQDELGRPLHLIAESDLNSPKVVNPVAIGGFAFTAQWLDDFHHALYVLLDEKGKERYEDFGSISQFAKAYKEGFVHSGEYVKFRKKKHGVSSAGVSGDKFVVFTSNHDQIGNRPDGGRLSLLIDFDRLKLAAAALILSPYVPMLFMGEEYGEVNPFYYFISHSDPSLIEAVRNGRKEEFKDFGAEDEWPDPQNEETFRRCVLNWNSRTEGRHGMLLHWNRKLISLRSEMKAFKNFNKNDIQVIPSGDSVLMVHRRDEGGENAVMYFFNFSETEYECSVAAFGDMKKTLDSKDKEWSEHGNSLSLAASYIASDRKICLPPLGFCFYERITNNG